MIRRLEQHPSLLWYAALGVMLLVFGVFTILQGLWLDSHGSTRQARVVAAQHGTKSDFVRVEFVDTGYTGNLWAWTGSPEAGATMTVVYDERNDWAKDARAFVPRWRLIVGFGGGLWFLCAPPLYLAWRDRRDVARPA